MRGWRLLLLLLVVAVAGAAVLYYFFAPPRERPANTASTGETRGQPSDQAPPGGTRRGSSSNRLQGPDQGPVPVLTATAKSEDVPVYLIGVGTVQAFYTVTVHAQVAGKLIAVPFHEGQEVKKGELLAQVDPALYQAAYDQAVAKKAQDEAQLANARLDLVRYTKLAQQNYGSQQQADTQKALVAQDEAMVKGDQAAIESAKANLDYTHITSPIDGRTGIRLVDVGNLVQPSDSIGIVVVTQLKPISVIFTLPEQNLPQVQAAAKAKKLPADAMTGDNRTVLDHGTLDVIDNQIDQTTGMLKFKANMPNISEQLWPGQFVNERMLVDTRHDAIVIPSGAVQQGPNGTYVYVVGDDSKATVTAISVAQQDDSIAVIASGLKAGQVVVTSGFVRLSNGAKVTIGKQSAPGSNAAGSNAAGSNAAGANAAGKGAATPAPGSGVPGQGQPETATPSPTSPNAATGTRSASPP